MLFGAWRVQRVLAGRGPEHLHRTVATDEGFHADTVELVLSRIKSLCTPRSTAPTLEMLHPKPELRS